MNINLFNSNKSRTDIAVAHYIGEYSVLYSIENEPSIRELFDIMKKGANRKDLLTTTRKDFDKRYSYLTTIQVTDLSEHFPEPIQNEPREVLDVVITYWSTDRPDQVRKQFEVPVDFLSMQESLHLQKLFKVGTVSDSNKTEVLKYAGMGTYHHAKVGELKICDVVHRGTVDN